MPAVEVVPGDLPVVLGLPHTGTEVPGPVAKRLNATGQALADTDWHVDRLYDGLLPGATRVRAGFHRYVIDANRPPDDESLYPGQNTTGLVPLTDFDGRPIWTTPPTASEITGRRETYHSAYHVALAGEIARLRAAHPHVLLFDCHSIRSRIPYLFDGTLPDLNIGTAGGESCAPALEAAACRIASDSGYAWVVNGRFRGGWTTRHYGAPDSGVHGVQMELAQSAYLADEAPPWTYDPHKAERLRSVLGPLLSELLSTLRTLPP